jgi:outer membrane protein OmpA-like peptidoglycan-associated protein
MAPTEDLSWSHAAKGISDSHWSLLFTGKRLLSSLFGSSEDTVNHALSASSGLRPGVMSTLLAVAAPMVMSFLGRKVRDEGLSMSGLGTMLQRESGTIRNALPASLQDLFWPGTATAAATASPVMAQAVVKERSTNYWPLLLVLAALIPTLLWIFNQGHRRAMTSYVPPPTGHAERSTEVTPMKRVMPEMIVLKFDTGSSRLRPESQEQLNRIAGMLAADPSFRMKANGYTDNVGNADKNMALSQQRANSVVAVLVDKGISSDRCMSEGHGEQDPVADNSTKEGRAENRRVTVGFEQ